MTRASSRAEWARGWPLVVAGAMGMVVTNLHVGAIGFVMQPLQSEFGWSRAEISASLMILCSCILAVSPVVGFIIDRLGARRVALAGLVLFSAAFAAVGLTGPNIWSWYLAWAAVGIVYPTASVVVWTLGVSRCFDRQRGLAFALIIGGGGISLFLSPLVAAAVAPVLGWRAVFFTLGIGGLILGWPLVWKLFDPDRIAREHAASPEAAGAPPLAGYSLRQTVRRPQFWSLTVVALLIAAAVGGLTLHFQPIMRDAGLTAAKAAGYAALLGPASIAGHLVAGRLMDMFPIRYVAAILFGAPAIACVILLNYDGSALLSVLVAIIIGVAAGIEGDVIAYLTARYFGLKHYGVVYGILVGLYSFGWGVAPVIAGAAFDAVGSYASVLWLLLAGLAVSAVLALLLGRPPEFDAQQEATP